MSSTVTREGPLHRISRQAGVHAGAGRSLQVNSTEEGPLNSRGRAR